MRFGEAHHAQRSSAQTRRGWLNLLRVTVGVTSLVVAFWVAMLLEPRVAREAHLRLTATLLAGGLLVFAAMMVWLGRDVTRAWLDFGARLGFGPATRRPLSDLGTDRPSLHGRAGAHCARLRFVVHSRARRADEWLQAELELVGVQPGWWLRYDGRALHASEPAIAARVRPDLGAFSTLRLQDGRLVARAPFHGFDEPAVREMLARAAHVADELQKPL